MAAAIKAATGDAADASAAAPAVDPGYFREVMAHIPTSVCVVAADHADGPAGLSVGSFVSVSLDPPLVGVFVAATSTSWPRVAAAGSFCISVLSDDHEHVSRRFAVSGGDKFAGLEWGRSPAGAPQLPGAVAWIDCELEAEYPAGDHTLVLGRVVELEAIPEAAPLIFHRGGYGRLSNDQQRED
jgi:3-hydroxy-9,10-secoandrosta-1,3,5(10)-triene-9,17-dione monooxygenase reductase component